MNLTYHKNTHRLPTLPHCMSGTNNDHIFNGFDNNYNYNYDDDYYGYGDDEEDIPPILFLLVPCAFFLILGCCNYVYNTSQNNDNSNTQHDRDLRQIRQRLSERGNRPRSSDDTTDDSIAVDRKELIKKNLFTRVIQREESVRELCEVLSISRGGYEVDEELGVCGSADRTTTSSPSEPAQPSPSAPSLESDTTNATTTVQIEQTAESTSLMPVHRLLANLIGSEREDGLFSNISLEPQSNDTKTTKKKQEVMNDNNTKQLECSICLECYSPNDTIAWAKDGGTNSSDAGCDHIFHQECLYAWLHEHSDCPLCRRVILHEDADTRFDLW